MPKKSRSKHYQLPDGTPIILTEQIGSGREGSVHLVEAFPGAVAKIFHEPQQNTGAKIDRIIENARSIDHSSNYSFAWPTIRIQTNQQKRSTAGYLMPYVNTRQKKEIGTYFNPTRRRIRTNQRNKGYTYLHLLNTACNLAHAVDRLHGAGFVIGDINSRNILTDDRGHITFIDTDSFQVPATPDSQFRCQVGTPEYTPPHLQATQFADIDRSQADDLFGLAIMIYQLLFQGQHPFSGLPQNSRKIRHHPTNITERIKAGSIVHVNLDNVPTETAGLIWSHLPLKRQFKTALSTSPAAKRYPAARWAEDINELSLKIQTCRKKSLHYYFGKSTCTWCRYQAITKIEPFPMPNY